MKSPELRQRKVQALPLEPLRPVVTSYTTQPTQNTITSLIAAPLDIRTHMVFALFSGVMYLGSALRGVRWELVPKAALPCALDGRTVGPHLCSRENLPQMGGSISPAIYSYIWCLHHAAGSRILASRSSTEARTQGCTSMCTLLSLISHTVWSNV